MGIKARKRWDSCLLWFIASLSALALTLSCINASDDVQSGIEAPTPGETGACGKNGGTGLSDRKLMFVSTLDGKLSALDIINDEEGQLLWSMAVDSRPLLSSSISKLEIMHEGVVTRYIPSLDGSLYKYDGASIEAVPMSADTLLSSSYKLGDNTMVIGGKDILSYGIDPNTGQIRYACGVKGCHVFGDTVSEFDDVLMVTRNTKTVRGVDATSGMEKWNFSVGQHDVKFIKGQQKVISSEDTDEEATVTNCYSEEDSTDVDTEVDMNMFSNSIKIVVPEGMVVGVDPENMHSVTWQFKFKSPISNAWLLYKGELREVGMFDNRHIPALSSFEPDEAPLHQPLLYVGMHQGQLYVQQSSQMQERISEAAETFNKQQHQQHQQESPDFSCARTNLPRVAWKPYLNTAQWRTPTLNNRIPAQIEGEGADDRHCDDEEEEEEEDMSALTIWHENYPFDNGFYLYPDFKGQDTDREWTEGNQSEYDEYLFEDYYPVSVTLWNWWKEVVAISTVTSIIISFLVHVILTRAQKREDLSSRDSSNSLSKSGCVIGRQSDSKDEVFEIEPPSRQNSDEASYVSRYYSDFELIQILGKGGFGVVFESKNKVDDCHYAVKRIALPNSEGAKEKVMREVKALAKLDHVGIVRYFHAWIECPPAGWQEERDQELLELSESPTSQTPGITTRMDTTSYTQSSYVPGSSPKSSQMKEAMESLAKSSPKASSPLDFLQNPFGGNNFDFAASNEADVKRGGSEEFSVHSDLWGNSGEFTDGDIESVDEESGSFSCLGTPKLSEFQLEDSVDIEFVLSDNEFSDSRNKNTNNNIPFKNTSSHYNISNRIEEIDEDSVQIVFEDSGCADRSSKESSSCNDYHVTKTDQSEQTSDLSDAKNSGSVLSVEKTNKSKTHSRSPSYTKLTYEREGKHVDQEKGGNSSTTGLVPLPKLYLFIQMQLCKHETLKDWLALNTLNRDRHMLLDVFDQITSAIEYVHELGLMHRDLKPSNIFFSLDGVVKMGDFGLVTALPEEQNEGQSSPGNPYRKHTARVGTQLYMSPEQTNGKVYTQKVDIYALGVILFELLYPFATQMERVRTLLDVRKQQFPERFSREMRDECTFAYKLLSEKPEERPTAQEILASPLLSEFEARRMPRRFRARTISQNSS